MIRRVLALPLAIAMQTSPSLSHAGMGDSAGGGDLLAMASTDEFLELSLESLMDIEVTSVSKRSEKLSAAAASIFVITGEELKRSGARNFPEALRLVPGLFVARTDAHTWVVTARGFGSTLADKMEVLLDGRSLYTPLFSGVFWEAQDTYFADVDRIEVIRGPGAALWGANAVNGVINIVTKSTADTQGAHVELAGGGTLKSAASARYGFAIGEKAHARVYAKQQTTDDQETASGSDAEDGYKHKQWGFRSDWQLTEQQSLTVQGDQYEGSIKRGAAEDETYSGFNLLARWQRQLPDGGQYQLQAYFDRTDRNVPGVFGEDRETSDIEFQHSFSLGERQQWVWGAGYRRSEDEIVNSAIVQFLPDQRDIERWSVFAQNQIALTPETLQLTLGVKVEDNDFTGTEVQPSVRLAWTPDDKRTLWGSLSRSVRTPNRLDDDILIASPASPTFFIEGNREFESEEVITLELGYRRSLTEKLSLDGTLFLNDYDQLRGVDYTGSPPQNPRIENSREGNGRGIEVLLHYTASPTWAMYLGGSFFELNLDAKDGFNDPNIANEDENDPRVQSFVRSVWQSGRLSWDGTLRHIETIEDQGTPSYTELDMRIAWQLKEGLELALVGSNLLDDEHLEYGNEQTGTRIKRSVHATATWSFEP